MFQRKDKNNKITNKKDEKKEHFKNTRSKSVDFGKNPVLSRISSFLSPDKNKKGRDESLEGSTSRSPHSSDEQKLVTKSEGSLKKSSSSSSNSSPTKTTITVEHSNSVINENIAQKGEVKKDKNNENNPDEKKIKRVKRLTSERGAMNSSLFVLKKNEVAFQQSTNNDGEKSNRLRSRSRTGSINKKTDRRDSQISYEDLDLATVALKKFNDNIPDNYIPNEDLPFYKLTIQSARELEAWQKNHEFDEKVKSISGKADNLRTELLQCTSNQQLSVCYENISLAKDDFQIYADFQQSASRLITILAEIEKRIESRINIKFARNADKTAKALYNHCRTKLKFVKLDTMDEVKPCDYTWLGYYQSPDEESPDYFTYKDKLIGLIYSILMDPKMADDATKCTDMRIVIDQINTELCEASFFAKPSIFSKGSELRSILCSMDLPPEESNKIVNQESKKSHYKILYEEIWSKNTDVNMQSRSTQENDDKNVSDVQAMIRLLNHVAESEKVNCSCFFNSGKDVHWAREGIIQFNADDNITIPGMFKFYQEKLDCTMKRNSLLMQALEFASEKTKVGFKLNTAKRVEKKVSGSM